VALALALVLLLCFTPCAAAQSSAPYWLLYEEGKTLASKKEYGEALVKFRQAIAVVGTFPEAEIAIGDIYKVEGEVGLSIKQYEKAYNLRNSLTIPEEKYEISYKLAGIFEEQQQYRDMESRLLEIIAEDKAYNPPKTSRLREQVVANFWKSDIDGVLKLYRFEQLFPARAHSKLGWFYYKTGRFDPAVEHLLYAASEKMKPALDAAMEADPEYQFTTLDDFLMRASSIASIKTYLEESALFADLYYLAGCAFQTGKPEHGVRLWKSISVVSFAGRFQIMSQRQLKSPWMEPYLVIPKQAARE
jgi:tetratricopeptide (TPR) repeat protein